MNTHDLIDIGMNVFMFWLGGKSKEAQIRNEITQHVKDQEIMILRQRLAQLEQKDVQPSKKNDVEIDWTL